MPEAHWTTYCANVHATWNQVVSGVEHAMVPPLRLGDPLALDALAPGQILGPVPSGFGSQVAPPEHSEPDAQNW